MRYCFLIMMLLSTRAAFSQPGKPLSPVVRHLMGKHGEVNVITCRFGHLLPKGSLPPELENEFQFFVHHSSGLYLGVSGTGYLYRVMDSAGCMQLRRVDSTFYVGHNFSAGNFTVQDTIYSFGGYGFWQSNGLLRYYQPNLFEWAIKRTDRDLPAVIPPVEGTMFWLDPVKAQFYLLGSKKTNEGLLPHGRMDTTDGKLYKLDLYTGTWSESGKLLSNIGGLNSPWGLLIHNNASVWYINDYKNNRKLKATAAANGKLQEIHSRIKSDVIYFIDSTVYFGSVSLPKFDSIKLSIRDFTDTGEPVYEPLAGKSNKAWWLVLPLLAIGGFIGWRGYKRHRQSAAPVMPPDLTLTAANTGHPQSEIRKDDWEFSSIEMDLLRLLLERSREENVVSLEEINRILGLSGKNLSVQKKNRSEVTNAINTKWVKKYGNRTVLVDRKRSEFDKRVFEYFIHPYWMPLLQKEINAANGDQGRSAAGW